MHIVSGTSLLPCLIILILSRLESACAWIHSNPTQRVVLSRLRSHSGLGRRRVLLLISFRDSEFDKLKVPELREELKKRGLSYKGRKGDLLERLKENATTPTFPVRNGTMGRFDGSVGPLPLFPRSMTAMSMQAAASVRRCIIEGKETRLIVNVANVLPGSQRRPPAVPGASATSSFSSVQRFETDQLFSAEHLGESGGADEEDSPALLLFCYKLAEELAALGMPRVRFVTQSVQAAMRLRQICYVQDGAHPGGPAPGARAGGSRGLADGAGGSGGSGGAEMSDAASVADPDEAAAAAAAAVAPPTAQSIRISVMGVEPASAKEQLHFGLALDDEVVVLVAPSTGRPNAGAGRTNLFSALDDLVGAARSLDLPVVMVNGRLRARRGSPYLVSTFTTAFEVDALAARHGRQESCALLRCWPRGWECYYHDSGTQRKDGYLYLGSFPDRPTPAHLEKLLKALDIPDGS